MNETVQDRDGVTASEFAREFRRRAVEVEDKLSKNDRRIVGYLREHLEELPFHTADSLAEATSVSRAAIVRLAHRLGYEGFAELRELARHELRAAGRSPLARFRAGDPDSHFTHKLQLDHENLALTQMMGEEAIAGVAEALAAAPSIYVVGNGVSAGLALYFHRVLHGVRPEVHFVDATFPDSLARISPGDAVVAFLFRRYSRLTVALIDRARELGATIVILGDGGGRRFAGEQDRILVAATESPTLYPSMVGAAFLLEALVAATAAANPERTQDTLEERERFISEQHLLLGAGSDDSFDGGVESL